MKQMPSIYGECPICCDHFTSPSELEFFPCPCGFQPCRFCVSQMPACPLCKKEYDKAGFRIVPNKFYHTEISDRPQLRIVSKRNLIIRRIPIKYCDQKILAKPEMLGQYGPWDSLVITSGVVYVRYHSEEQAEACANALNMSFFDGSQIKVTYGYLKFCSAFTNDRTCHNPSCPYVHEAKSTMGVFHIEQEQQELDDAIRVPNLRGRETFFTDKMQKLMFPPTIATQHAVSQMLSWKCSGDIMTAIQAAAASQIKK